MADEKLASGGLSVYLSADTGFGLKAFVDDTTGRNLIAAGAPLYRLEMSENGHPIRVLTSQDAVAVEISRPESESEDSLALRFRQHADLDIDVECLVIVGPREPVSRWRITIHNRTPLGVRAIHYPVILSPRVEDSPRDMFAWGYMGGQLIHDPATNIGKYPDYAFFRNQHPGVVSIQMQCRYDGSVGLYLATEDTEGSTKRFGAVKMDDDTLDLTIEHNYDEQPGISIQLPYDTVIRAFHGDWYTAADIYREWTVKQHWCSKRTAERTDIPAWLKEPRPWLAVISQGIYERLRGVVWTTTGEWPLGRFWPARKVVPIMREYSRLFNTPVVAWMEGWEKIGAPGGPVDIFPPREGAESYRQAMDALIAEGNLPFAYLSAFHWCYKKPAYGYDGHDRFLREGHSLAALNDQQKVDEHLFPSSQKYFAQMCVGSAATRTLVESNLMALMDLGAVALQIDQQLGLYASACYSREHGHNPGYGPWMYKSMRAFVRSARRAIKERNPNGTLGYETPCEVWIQDVDVHMDRPYYVRPFGHSSIPLFGYLYHEYALTYGGDAYMGLHHPEVDLIKHALLAVSGVQNLIGIGQPEWDYEVDPEYGSIKLMRSIADAQRTFAHEFLVHGEMIKPSEMDVPSYQIDLYRHAALWDSPVDVGTHAVPSVMHSVWRTVDGRLGYVLGNWTSESVEARVSLAGDGPTSVVTAGHRRTVARAAGRDARVRVTVPARSVLLLEQGTA